MTERTTESANAQASRTPRSNESEANPNGGRKNLENAGTHSELAKPTQKRCLCERGLRPSVRTAESTSNSEKCASCSARTSPAIHLSEKRADEAALRQSVMPRIQSRPWRLAQGTRRSNCVIRTLTQKFVTFTPSREFTCFGDHSFRTILCQLGAESGMAIRSYQGAFSLAQPPDAVSERIV